MEINTAGIEDLIVTITEAISKIDLKAIEFESGLASLLTQFSDIWNPIWKAVTAFLEGSFGL